MSFWIYLVFFIAFFFWAIGGYGISRSLKFGQRACAHLPRSEQRYYFSQLGMSPIANNRDDMLALIGNESIEDHERALSYVRIGWLGILLFMAWVLIFFLTCVILKLTSFAA
jgi:hypothetical protein